MTEINLYNGTLSTSIKSMAQFGAQAEQPLRRFVTDVWTDILSFLGFEDLCRVSVVSKDMLSCLQLTKCIFVIEQQRMPRWDAVGVSLAKYFPQTKYFRLHATNCTDQFICHIASFLMLSGRKINFSISKCFSVGQDVFIVLPLCENIAICDITIFPTPSPIPVSLAPVLKTLILSNCQFLNRDILNKMLRLIPSTLNLLALGGTVGLSNLHLVEDSEVCVRQDIVVECTFLEDPDTIHLRTLFPNALFMNFQKDSLQHLDMCMRVIQLSFDCDRFSFSEELLSCASPRDRRTPLHVACYTPDMERCEWLVRHGARLMALDVRGYTPLHQAVNTFVHANSRNSRDMYDDVGIHGCVRVLLAAGANCFAKNQATESPLLISCQKGDFESLKLMLNKIRYDEHIKCYMKSLCRCLPESITTHKDYKQYTLLHGAMFGRNINCCRALLEPDDIFFASYVQLRDKSHQENHLIRKGGMHEVNSIKMAESSCCCGDRMRLFINDAQNPLGITALELAQRISNDDEITQLLVKNGAVLVNKTHSTKERRGSASTMKSRPSGGTANK